MAEILSQEEIDALLSALDVQDIPEDVQPVKGTRRVKEYDFRRPDKFSKDQIRTINMIMEAFARSWSTFLSGKLRSLVSVEIVSLDQLPYEEFIKSTFSPSVIAVISMEPLEGNAILDISPPVAFAIIERMVGGIGTGTTQVRELTEIEEALIVNVVGDALRVLKTAMGELIQTNPRLEAVEYNPQFTQIVPPSDMTLFISLEMRIEDSRGWSGSASRTCFSNRSWPSCRRKDFSGARRKVRMRSFSAPRYLSRTWERPNWRSVPSWAEST